ncbi:DUF5979 domain-containing protein, partial [Georgenia alba]
ALDGEAAGEVPGDAQFTVEYSTDGGQTWQPLTITADGTPVTVEDLPAGTEVQLRETDQRPDINGVEWGEVTLTVNGEPVDGDTATFPVGPDAGAAVVVTNTADVPPDEPPGTEPPGTEPPGTEPPDEPPLVPGLPITGATGVGLLVALAVLAVAAGLLLIRIRRGRQ